MSVPFQVIDSEIGFEQVNPQTISPFLSIFHILLATIYSTTMNAMISMQTKRVKYIVGDGFVENKIDKFSYSVSDGDAVVTGQVYVLLEDLMKPEEVFIQTQVIFFFRKANEY